MKPTHVPEVTPLHQNWTSIPAESLGGGIERQMIIGNDLMVCRLRFAPHTVTATHNHRHEQITLVEQGRVRFTIAGVERLAEPGDVLHFPADTPHGVTVLEDEAVLIDIFTPLRHDLLEANQVLERPVP